MKIGDLALQLTMTIVYYITEGKIQSPVSSNGWNSRSATFTVVTDGLKSLTGWNLFDQLVLAVTQFPCTGNQVNTFLQYSEIKEYIALTFPNLISRIGRSKDHVAKSNFHKKLSI